MADLEPVHASVIVPGAPEDVFARFTRDIHQWWPIGYTFSGDRLAGIEIRSGDGAGEWLERDQDGQETTWGALTAWTPPEGFTAEFAISAERTVEPPGRRSRVRFRFTAEEGGTRVAVDHDRFERHGPDAAPLLRKGMASGQGWPLILAEFARETRRRGAAAGPFP